MRSDLDAEEQNDESAEEFLQDVLGQVARGFVEATLYASVGAAVLSQTGRMNYSPAEAALDGTIGGVLMGVSLGFLNKGLESLMSRVYHTRPCATASVFMSSPIEQVKTFGKWLAQSVIFAGGAGLGNSITDSAVSPKEAIIAGEVGLGVVVASVVGSLAIIASAAGAVQFIERRCCAHVPEADSLSASLGNIVPRPALGATHLLYKKDDEEPLAEKNHVMTIMPH